MPQPAREPLRVLLVEDDDATRHLYERVLTRRGHRVTPCRDAESAWQACQAEPFALMILDWLLPGMDGLELCRRVRSHPNGENSVVLLVTVRDEVEDLVAILEAGADDYLAKPFTVPAFQVRLAVAERHVAQVQARVRAEAALREATRLEGALLAARTVEHYLGNQLGLTLGYTELLAHDPALPERVRELVADALYGAREAVGTLERLVRISRLDEADHGDAPTVLDLERSMELPEAVAHVYRRAVCCRA